MSAGGALARPVLALSVAAWLMAGLATPVGADETDNFTCRSQLTVDAQPVLDRRVDDLIQLAVDRANRKRPECDAACLARELGRHVGGSAPSPGTLIPHARLALWAARRDDLDRCRIRFSDSIYGARPYDQPWLWPLTHRVIFLADSILLTGHVIGLDKINHFIREGQVHYDEVEQGSRLEDTLRAALGQSDRPLAMTEYGLRGRALTGVLSYADLAASYAGFLFWSDLLTLDRPGAFVSVDEATNRFVVRRRFTFADYVTEAWDEAINRSEFHPELRRGQSTAPFAAATSAATSAADSVATSRSATAVTWRSCPTQGSTSTRNVFGQAYATWPCPDSPAPPSESRTRTRAAPLSSG